MKIFLNFDPANIFKDIYRKEFKKYILLNKLYYV